MGTKIYGVSKSKLVAFLFMLLSQQIHAEISCSATRHKDEWNYLYENDSFSTRYLVMTDILKDENISRVVEIGGFCTPACMFNQSIDYTNIDPFIDANVAQCNPLRSELIKKSFEDMTVNDIRLDTKFALVWLGIWLEKLKTPLEKNVFVKELLARASAVFLETVPNNPGNEQLQTLRTMAKAAGLRETYGAIFIINKGITDDNRYKRQFYYYKR